MMKSYPAVSRPMLVLSLAVICTALAGCVMSDKTHPEEVRTISLADFAGTYKNQIDPNHGYSGFTLTDIVWPKHPPAVSSGKGDYRGIDRVKVAVDGKKVTLTFLMWGKVFDRVIYEEGKDFHLSNSVVGLKTESGAAATLGKGGEEMAGMIPVLPAAGAIVQGGKLFLNSKGDIVVRTDSTVAALVFFVAPVVLRDGKDTVFERVTEEQDRQAGYAGPRSYDYPFGNIYEVQRTILEIMESWQNAVCIASLKTDQLFVVKKSPGSYVIEVRLALWGTAPINAERSPNADNSAPPDLPKTSILSDGDLRKLRSWLSQKPIEQHEQDVRIDFNGKHVGQERVWVLHCGANEKLAKELLQYLVKDVFGHTGPMSWPHLKLTYWD